VERYKQIKDFTPEKFWSLNMRYERQRGQAKEEVKFEWARHRIFDKLVGLVLYEKCLDAQQAKVIDVQTNRRTRYRPQPLNTIEAQKMISNKLKMSSAKAMEVMEKLYNRGFLSYPRTETTIFAKTINLRKVVEEMQKSDEFGGFAERVVTGEMWAGPRNGKSDDKAHPPIHPVKIAYKNDLKPDEWRVYEIVSRHFLACISKDAVGSETKIDVVMGEEKFSAKGLTIQEYNWLEVFPYEKWSDSIVPVFRKGDTFVPTELKLADGETQAPKPLSESDLISKMDQHGIGTDATIHEHIKTV